ncbi:MAG: GtrA family protein [Burkholderiales bacterium]|jgi:putative flippase GtrA
MIRHLLTAQFAVFLLVGGTAAAANWLARLVLSTWLAFGWAVVAAYAIGMLSAFLLNRRFVFPRSTRPVALQARDFVLINVVSFPVVWLAAIGLDAGLRALGMPRFTQELAHAVAVALPAVVSFLLYKFVAFRDPSPAAPPR